VRRRDAGDGKDARVILPRADAEAEVMRNAPTPIVEDL
jgi:hypothetical protein